jgi:hypothetical protein
VLRFNAQGPEGLIAIKAPGPQPKLEHFPIILGRIRS